MRYEQSVPTRAVRTSTRLRAALGAAVAAMTLASGVASGADRVKIGLMTTLSGPGGVVGEDIRDAFQLFVRLNGAKLGGLPAEVIVADDQANPEVGKQTVDRLIKRDRVDLMTGIIFSNILLPALPAMIDARMFYVSPNTGPQDYAGEKCSPFFFVASWQNEDIPAAMGQHATDRGLKTVYMITPNYPGGRETLNGFKRTYKGKTEEVYTRFGQLDYAAEISQMRAAKPEAAFVFLPGGMGVNFVKQFVAAGLSRDIQLILPGFSADEDSIRGLGDNLLGIVNSSHWSHDMDNAANRRFVSEFEKAYKRLPSMYAAQSYDAAQMIDAGIRQAKGRIEDRDALRKGLRATQFQSVRGSFKLNNNHFPIQDYYLRIVSRDAQGRVTNRLLNRIYASRADAFAASCPMKW